ncbi:hypothetical protein FIBSPDRAFT_413170 [Athelia psychrophila]|uniref:Uncharacterized protein n=1 Tax=Athelia psychrophila TaxID=1759441 RepID=A0A167UWG1_9AGAM|nr:hypothetical protein FIBSPDRAFT_413170 [Fibularhizoctonia sp. CBS 109695]
MPAAAACKQSCLVLHHINPPKQSLSTSCTRDRHNTIGEPADPTLRQRMNRVDSPQVGDLYAPPSHISWAPGQVQRRIAQIFTYIRPTAPSDRTSTFLSGK